MSLGTAFYRGSDGLILTTDMSLFSERSIETLQRFLDAFYLHAVCLFVCFGLSFYLLVYLFILFICCLFVCLFVCLFILFICLFWVVCLGSFVLTVIKRE